MTSEPFLASIVSPGSLCIMNISCLFFAANLSYHSTPSSFFGYFLQPDRTACKLSEKTFPSRSSRAPQALTEMALDCMDPGEQEFLQNLSSTQEWFTIENNSYQAPSGTLLLWLTDYLPVSCNFKDSNLFFALEPSIEAQSELSPSPMARQTNFTNATALAEPHSLTALLND